MKDSEILSDLISLAFDSNPKDTSISLRDCIDLLTRTIIRESQGIGISEIVAKQHALFADRAPEHPAAVKPSIGPGAPGSGEAEPNEADTASTFKSVGIGAAEKREVFERLSDYRRNHGLGSLAVVAKATNGVMTEDEIRAMLAGDKYPLAKWKIVGSALDFVTKKE